MAPTTRYARSSGGAYIAYQVVGEGPLDLVLVPAFLSQDRAPVGGTRGRLGCCQGSRSFSRLILSICRGTGLSDGTRPRDGRLTSRSTTCAAVLAATGARRAPR